MDSNAVANRCCTADRQNLFASPIDNQRLEGRLERAYEVRSKIQGRHLLRARRPPQTGIISKETALISRVLRDNGFATSMFGEWHSTPEGDISPAGPFDRWPTGLGFDYFYGFNQGEAHHFYPTLYHNTVAVESPLAPGSAHRILEKRDDGFYWQEKKIEPADAVK